MKTIKYIDHDMDADVDLYYGVAAYNEEKNIESCLKSLVKQDIRVNVKTIVCLNGCSDNTINIVSKIKNDFPQLNIEIIFSQKGIAFALNAIIRTIKNRTVPIIFLDADVILDNLCVRILYEEITNSKRLIIIGGWPVPWMPETLSLSQLFCYKVLHLRAFFPAAEVAALNVTHFKTFVKHNPQPTISIDFELCSKIYFHGRIYIIKNSRYFQMPESENIADDTFLANMVHTKYGPGTIRIRYDARAYYKPYLSLKEHFNTYRRVFLDKLYLDKNIKSFAYSRLHEQTKLNWKFIFSQKKSIVVLFILYFLIKTAEEYCYKILPKKPISSLWRYNCK